MTMGGMGNARQIGITGVGGRLGRLVAEGLLRVHPATNLRFMSRNVSKLMSFEDLGCQCARVDFSDQFSMKVGFAGLDVLLIISADGPNDLRLRQHLAAIDIAKQAGVGRVVYTSIINPVPDSLFDFAKCHGETESCLKGSGLDYTIVRDGLYMENLDVFLASGRHSGVLCHPGIGGPVSYISRRDIAMAIVNVLVQSGHEGKIYELTGREAVNLLDIAQLASAAWGRPVAAIEMAPDEFRVALQSFGLPPFMVEAIGGLYAAVGAGEYAGISTDAERLNGWKPMSTEAYLNARVEGP